MVGEPDGHLRLSHGVAADGRRSWTAYTFPWSWVPVGTLKLTRHGQRAGGQKRPPATAANAVAARAEARSASPARFSRRVAPGFGSPLRGTYI